MHCDVSELPAWELGYKALLGAPVRPLKQLDKILKISRGWSGLQGVSPRRGQLQSSVRSHWG